MPLSQFIIEHLDEIVSEWEVFARTQSPASDTMDVLALRDHARQMLEAIARDIETSQSAAEQSRKSRGLGPVFHGVETAAATHGILRHAAGFDLRQLVAEFRALRASVLRLWAASAGPGAAEHVYEMTRFNEAIDQALAESVATYSKELAKSREIFLAILGHDLRSPLSALSGTLHLLSRVDATIDRQQALATARRSVTTMDGMIRDLLEYTKTRLGTGIPIAPAEANLERVCKAAVDEVSLAYPQTAFRYESSGPLDGVFDGARMYQVVSNLLNNAVQHGRRDAPVTLIAEGSEEALSLRVRNEGTPISPESLQVIFEPLVQTKASGSDRNPTNLGLGLFIAREIVLAHGGTIDASSTAAAGTQFTVRLPRT